MKCHSLVCQVTEHQLKSLAALPFYAPPTMMALQQRSRQQQISHTQSLAVVQTLLRAGLGCITFLR